MAYPEELSGLQGPIKCTCGAMMNLQVCHSPAGYYLGYWCDNCGPWSRETGYFQRRDEADAQLAIAQAGEVPDKLRDTEFHP